MATQAYQLAGLLGRGRPSRGPEDVFLFSGRGRCGYILSPEQDRAGAGIGRSGAIGLGSPAVRRVACMATPVVIDMRPQDIRGLGGGHSGGNNDDQGK